MKDLIYFEKETKRKALLATGVDDYTISGNVPEVKVVKFENTNTMHLPTLNGVELIKNNGEKIFKGEIEPGHPYMVAGNKVINYDALRISGTRELELNTTIGSINKIKVDHPDNLIPICVSTNNLIVTTNKRNNVVFCNYRFEIIKEVYVGVDTFFWSWGYIEETNQVCGVDKYSKHIRLVNCETFDIEITPPLHDLPTATTRIFGQLKVINDYLIIPTIVEYSGISTDIQLYNYKTGELTKVPLELGTANGPVYHLFNFTVHEEKFISYDYTTNEIIVLNIDTLIVSKISLPEDYPTYSSHALCFKGSIELFIAPLAMEWNEFENNALVYNFYTGEFTRVQMNCVNGLTETLQIKNVAPLPDGKMFYTSHATNFSGNYCGVIDTVSGDYTRFDLSISLYGGFLLPSGEILFHDPAHEDMVLFRVTTDPSIRTEQCLGVNEPLYITPI